MSSTRRNILIGLGTAPVAAIPAAGSVAASRDLDALIAAHRHALASFHAAIDAEQAAELAHSAAHQDNGLGGFLDSEYYSREDVKTLIEDAFETAREHLAVYEKIAPGSTVTIRAVADEKEAATLAYADALFDQEAPELRGAQLCVAEASNAEDAAALAVCSYRCHTLDEVRRKAAYVATIPTIADDGNELFLTFLAPLRDP